MASSSLVPLSSLPARSGHCVYVFLFNLPEVQCTHWCYFLAYNPYCLLFANDSRRGTLSFVILNCLVPIWFLVFMFFSTFHTSTQQCCSKYVSLLVSFSPISCCQWLLVFQDPSSMTCSLEDTLILTWEWPLVPLSLFTFVEWLLSYPIIYMRYFHFYFFFFSCWQ